MPALINQHSDWPGVSNAVSADERTSKVCIKPERIEGSLRAVVGDQPVPVLIDQHYRSGGVVLVIRSLGGQRGPGEVVGCGLDVGHDDIQRQNTGVPSISVR